MSNSGVQGQKEGAVAPGCSRRGDAKQDDQNILTKEYKNEYDKFDD